MAENKKVLVYRKKWKMNIGIVLFGILFLYLIVLIISYATRDKVSTYEVHMGTILNDESYTGMAIREEKVVPAEKSGYVTYPSADNRKVKMGADVCLISPEKLSFQKSDSDTNTGSETELTDEQQNSLGLTVQAFTDNFTESMFAEVYSFKDSVQNTISNISSANKGNSLDQIVSEGKGTGFTATGDGIVVYNTDGYENLKAEDVTSEMFNKTDYTLKELYNNQKVRTGDPLYKLVTSENWTVVVPISDKTAKELEEKTSVRVRFKKDNQTLIAGLNIEKKEKEYIAYLSFSSSMIRYADERFLDIELIIEDETGLKIPKSAVTEKEFYVVPEEYLTQGGNSSDKGVLKKTENGTEFISLTVYYTEDSMAYLSMEDLEEGDTILKPESNMIYTIKDKGKLQGVFNINKGYAVFEQIKVLCESEDYYIVESGNSYSLANYDHIALNAEHVKENDIISQ